MDTRPDELEHFKAEINLSAFAASLGYELDRRSTSRNSAAMKHPGGDKIIIGLQGRHWVYFSVHEQHSGTIIDLLQHRKGLNLGQARRALRAWIGVGGQPPTPHTAPPHRSQLIPSSAYVHRLEPITPDLLAVRRAYEATRPIDGDNSFLCRVRGIPTALLADPRFASSVRVDDRTNVVFPHFNHDGLCGFELKNTGFTGFARGGSKGLWGSRKEERDHTLVIAESGVDALSYAALFGHEGTRFVSTAGQLNDTQPGLIRSAIEELGGGRVVAAVDHDAGGDELWQRLKAVCSGHRNPVSALERHSPPNTGQDWNDALRASVGDPEPFPHRAPG